MHIPTNVHRQTVEIILCYSKKNLGKGLLYIKQAGESTGLVSWIRDDLLPSIVCF